MRKVTTPVPVEEGARRRAKRRGVEAIVEDAVVASFSSARFLKDPWTALGRSNIPQEVINELIDGLTKVGLGTFPVVN